jgi:hypothetical protein
VHPSQKLRQKRSGLWPEPRDKAQSLTVRAPSPYLVLENPGEKGQRIFWIHVTQILSGLPADAIVKISEATLDALERSLGVLGHHWAEAEEQQ